MFENLPKKSPFYTLGKMDNFFNIKVQSMLFRLFWKKAPTVVKNLYYKQDEAF